MFRGLSVNPKYLWASYHVYKIGCLLVRGISLPAAQLFLVAIDNILRRGCVGNLTGNMTIVRRSVKHCLTDVVFVWLT